MAILTKTASTPDRPVLVLGATGTLGLPVVREFGAAGVPVRALVRDTDRAAAILGPQVERVPGDVRDPDAVRTALAGCAGAYLSLRSTEGFEPADSAELIGLRNVLGAARHQTLDWIACISGAGDLARYAHLPPLRIKYQMEQLLRNSGLPYTVFKPTHFMESLPLFVRQGRASIPGRQRRLYHYLAARDYARIVVQSFVRREHIDSKLTVLGPAAYTMRQALEIYADICLPRKGVGQVPLPLLRLLGTIGGDPQLRMVHTLFKTFAQVDSETDDGAEVIVPEAPLRLEDWCRLQLTTAAA